MSDILDKIIAVKRQEIAAAQKKSPLEAVRFDAESRVLTRDFEGAPQASVRILTSCRRAFTATGCRDTRNESTGEF